MDISRYQLHNSVRILHISDCTVTDVRILVTCFYDNWGWITIPNKHTVIKRFQNSWQLKYWFSPTGDMKSPLSRCEIKIITTTTYLSGIRKALSINWRKTQTTLFMQNEGIKWLKHAHAFNGNRHTLIPTGIKPHIILSGLSWKLSFTFIYLSKKYKNGSNSIWGNQHVIKLKCIVMQLQNETKRQRIPWTVNRTHMDYWKNPSEELRFHWQCAPYTASILPHWSTCCRAGKFPRQWITIIHK